jgi:ATP-dependent Clp protease, protease subunit
MTDDIKNKMLAECVDNRTLIINKAIDDSIIEDIIFHIINFNIEDNLDEADSKSYDRKTNPIKLYINSGGGDVTAMFSLINAMETSKTPIFTYAMGKAFSAAFMIFITGHVRFAQRYSNFMYHQTSYMRGGEHQYHVELMDYDKEVQDIAEAHVLKYTKLPKKKLDEIRKSKVDWHFLASSNNDEYKNKYKIFDLYY